MMGMSPSTAQYAPTNETVQPPANPNEVSTVGPLPFSGYDLGGLALIGAVLIAFGLAMTKRAKGA